MEVYLAMFLGAADIQEQRTIRVGAPLVGVVPVVEGVIEDGGV